MGHATKACVTPCLNLAAESQKYMYTKIMRFLRKKFTFGMLFCEENSLNAGGFS